MKPGKMKNIGSVAVVVATYNSAQFILETLESIKTQSYPELELIITDDASTDNTIKLVMNWLKEIDGQNRFCKVEIIATDKNTGVSANCNRAINIVESQWVKLIAGDDILLPNCIADNIDFISNNTESKILFSKVRNYINTFTLESYSNTSPSKCPFYCVDPTITSLDQYKLLLLGDRINYSPSCFFHKDTIMAVGGYDESNRLFEDYPMWLKLTKAGYRLYFMDKETVGYRRHNSATTNNHETGLVKSIIFEVHRFKIKSVYPFLPSDIACQQKFTIAISWLFYKSVLNRNTRLFRGLYKVLSIYLNPFKYIVTFKAKVLKLGAYNIFYRY